MDFDPIPNLYLGTSSWSAESWVGPFYPPGTPPTDKLDIVVLRQIFGKPAFDFGITNHGIVNALADFQPAVKIGT